MLKLDVRSDVSAFARTLDNVAKRQVRFATSLALNAAAKEARRVARRAIPEDFDRPVPFTENAVGTTPARKERLVAKVFLKDRQGRYLGPSILGEDQLAAKPAGKAVLVPIDAKTNKYGNLPRGMLARLKGRKDVFIGTVTLGGREVSGVFQRPQRGGQLRILITFDSPVRLKQRYPWDAMVRAAVAETFPVALRQAMTRALATAR